MPQLTRLGVGGGPRGTYGSFAGKSVEAHPVAEITRLGPDATPRRLYGSFAGKTPTIPPVDHPVGKLTRLGMYGAPRGLYGDFASKALTEIEEDLGGSTWLKSQRERDMLLREDEELLSLITSIVTSGIIR